MNIIRAQNAQGGRPSIKPKVNKRLCYAAIVTIAEPFETR
jgi:hypothetical protein